MSDYTPTTAYLRESYAREKHPDLPDLIQLRREGFDRWLAEHDREVAERAWSEGLDAQKDYAWRCEDADAAGQWHIVPAPKNPYRKGEQP